MQKWLKQGPSPEKPGEIALEKHFAKIQKAGPGDTFLIGGHTFNITSIIESKEGVEVSAANIYMPIDSARVLLTRKPEAMNLTYKGESYQADSPSESNIIFGNHENSGT